ncbi:MAG: ATP-binding protein [Saprospiraceae bacterium]
MNIKLSLFFSYFFFLSFWQMHAQEHIIDVQQFGVEEGLLHRKVNTIFEDKNGLIWLGGDQGLQRYDGHEFKSWTKTNRANLTYKIISIGQDDAGWLWLWNGEEMEFVFLHSETEEILTTEERFGNDFPLVQINASPNGNWEGGSKNLAVSSQGKLLFTTTNGELISYDSKQGFQFKKIENEISCRILLIDDQDHLWTTVVNEGIYKLNIEGEILKFFPIKKGYTAGNFSTRNGKIYFTYFPSNRLNTGTLYEIDSNDEMNSIANHSFGLMMNNLYWGKSDIGWEMYDSLDSLPLHIIKKSDFDLSLTENAIPYVDSKERIWTYGQYGLSKIEIRPSKFRKHFSFETEEAKPIRNSARGIWVDQDTIFVNMEHSHFIRLDKNDSKNWQILNEENAAAAVRPLLRNEDGTFWVGTSFSIQKINRDGKLLEKFDTEQKSIIGMTGIWSLFKDKNEKIWIGGGGSLGFKNKSEDKTHIFQSKDDPTNFTKRRGAIQNMIPTKNGKVWFCSLSGLYLFDPIEEKILARYAIDEKGSNYLPSDIFYYLYEDNDGIKWIGTSDGLIRWDQNATTDSQFKLFTRNDGLSNNVIYAIFEDQHNRLWLSSDYGIMSFDKTTFDVKTYLEKDGISHHEFNRTSQFQSKDGTIYFGGLNGITSFHPDDFIQQKKDQAKMLISGYEIFDGKTETLVDRVGELRQSKTINFYPSDRFFRIKFALPSYEDLDKILYGWKMEGVDADWNFQKGNTLQFGALPYGTHTLRIKGQSSTGGWSPHELAIKVNVFKPFYLQFWFLALGVFSLVAGAFLFYKIRTSQFLQQKEILETEIQKATQQIQNDKSIIEADKITIELQAEELKELDKLKSRFFANVSHELRTPLTLMLGPISSAIKRGELSNRDFTLLKTAQQNGQDLLKLIAAILDLSKMESGKMELEETPELLFPLVRRIASNFESHAQRGGVQFNFKYDAEQDLQVEVDKGKLEIILNNLLSNAVKFTPAGGKISIEVEDLKSKLKITVSDSGRGIHFDDLPHVFDRFYQSKQPDAPTEGGTGIGLALSQEFVKMMNGKIWVESEFGNGATFLFEIPRKEVLGMVETEKMEEEEIVAMPVLEILENKQLDKNKQSTILIVEDNHSLRQYLETILSNDFNVLTAVNGQVAMDVLTNAKKALTDDEGKQLMPQLILSDIMMPIMDGFQLLETVKAKEDLSHLPMVMLTARADIKDKLKALRIGVDDYLLKPFEEDELLVRIHNLLKNYQQRIQAVEDLSDKKEETKEAPPTPIISRADQKWLDKLEKILRKELSNSQYSMSNLAHDLDLSERQLRRRIKQLIGITPAQYLKETRLHQARELLENKKYKTIAKTASAVGFQDVRTFSRNFSAHFGKKPSGYIIN